MADSRRLGFAGRVARSKPQRVKATAAERGVLGSWAARGPRALPMAWPHRRASDRTPGFASTLSRCPDQPNLARHDIDGGNPALAQLSDISRFDVPGNRLKLATRQSTIKPTGRPQVYATASVPSMRLVSVPMTCLLLASGMRTSRRSAHAWIPLANAGVRYGNGTGACSRTPHPTSA